MSIIVNETKQEIKNRVVVQILYSGEEVILKQRKIK